jgi:hypothetical protein
LKEVGLLEENRGAVSAIAFSPNGTLLAAGDVRVVPLGLSSVANLLISSQEGR